MLVTGTCECGSVTYTITNSPLNVYVCHCRNCQTRSGSAFAEHAMVSVTDFECTGSTVAYGRSANGIQFEELFCQSCHTRLFNRNSMLPDIIFLRAGTLANSNDLEPMAHIWIKRKQAWVTLPDDVPVFDESPTRVEFGVAIKKAEQRRRG